MRQQLVADPEPRHRRKVAVHDAARHVLRQPRGLVAACLDRVQHLGLQRLVLRPRGVEVAHARVEVPAVVVELPRDALHVGERLLLEVQEAHHHVGHLHAGVVDVVLDPDVEAAVAQQPHEGVAEARVAQVSDVGRLVRIDAGVLDDHVPRTPRGRGRLGERAVQARSEAATVQEQVQVAPAGHLGAQDVGRAGELSGQPLGDLARLAPQRLGQIERCRQGQVAELDPGRILEGDGAWIDVESGPRGLLYRPREALLEIQDHSHQSYSACPGAYRPSRLLTGA